MSDTFNKIENQIKTETVSVPYLSNLNETQLEAVKNIDGPSLILAGAGTGKTRTLTTRLAHILVQGRASPWEILAVTFTNKAARELKDRVSDLTGRSVEGWWVGTFHSIGARILRLYTELVGLKPNFTILDTDDQTRLIKQLIESYGFDDKRWPPRALLGVIQKWKDRGLSPKKVTSAEGADNAEGKILALYHDYQTRLKTLNAVDFGDLLLLCLELFQNQPQILSELQNKFRYILVDEYQDTNVFQYLWLRLLAQYHNNICCVGDDDQSIYSWRGAEVANILRFETDFPGAEIVRLEQNYRSTPHILAAASGLISHNEDRLGKTLWTQKNEGDQVKVNGVWDGEEEARFVSAEIENLYSTKVSLNQVAILVRASFQTREFEERLITLGIPYRIIGGARFYERQEIRDAIAYLRVIAQPNDDLALERIINVPKRGIGNATMQIIHQFARLENYSLAKAILRLTETDELKPKIRQTLSSLMTDFSRWRSTLEHVSLSELTGTILDESGYIEIWQQNEAPEAAGRLENLKELLVALNDFESLTSFLEHISLVMENDKSTSEEKVTIITLHGAKGLEFEFVFLPGWEDGLFPHQRSLNDLGTGGLEEERRLAYVGITRAKKRAQITYAANRRIYGKWQSAYPSRFIEELPTQNVLHESNPGLSIDREALRTNKITNFSNSRQLKYDTEHDINQDLEYKNGSWQIDTDEPFLATFSVGERVFHQKFGYGLIISIDGPKLEIEFEKAGTKRVVDSFVSKHRNNY